MCPLACNLHPCSRQQRRVLKLLLHLLRSHNPSSLRIIHYSSLLQGLCVMGQRGRDSPQQQMARPSRLGSCPTASASAAAHAITDGTALRGRSALHAWQAKNPGSPMRRTWASSTNSWKRPMALDPPPTQASRTSGSRPSFSRHCCRVSRPMTAWKSRTCRRWGDHLSLAASVPPDPSAHGVALQRL